MNILQLAVDSSTGIRRRRLALRVNLKKSDTESRSGLDGTGNYSRRKWRTAAGVKAIRLQAATASAAMAARPEADHLQARLASPCCHLRFDGPQHLRSLS